YVEAIPMEVLRTVDYAWETIPQYMDRLDRHVGVNVGTLVGHSTVRHYVMGDECQGRSATPEEIEAMRGIVRDAIQAGALGLSVSGKRGHYDPQGTLIPALWAEEDEMFALGDVLRELGTGIIQSGGGRDAELKNRLMSRLSEATGRTVVYNNLGQTARKPDEWKQLMALVDESSQAGIRAYPLCTPNSTTQLFTMRNCQLFRGSPTWHPILLGSDEDKLRAYSDPAVRHKLHEEVVEWRADMQRAGFARNWYDYKWVQSTVVVKNEGVKGQSVLVLAKAQGKEIIDAFLDLVVEENVETACLYGDIDVAKGAMSTAVHNPNVIVSLYDGGAH